MADPRLPHRNIWQRFRRSRPRSRRSRTLKPSSTPTAPYRSLVVVVVLLLPAPGSPVRRWTTPTRLRRRRRRRLRLRPWWFLPHRPVLQPPPPWHRDRRLPHPLREALRDEHLSSVPSAAPQRPLPLQRILSPPSLSPLRMTSPPCCRPNSPSLNRQPLRRPHCEEALLALQPEERKVSELLVLLLRREDGEEREVKDGRAWASRWKGG